MVIIGWLAFAVILGVYASNGRGRSGLGWFLLALLISPLLAWLLVLALPSKKQATDNAHAQMFFDALEPAAQARVVAAQAERKAKQDAVARVQYKQKFVIVCIAIVVALLWAMSRGHAVPGFTFKYTCTTNEAAVTDGKDDPVVKADIAIHLVLVDESHAQPGFFVSASHTTASGATYDVFAKYPDAQTGKVIEWGVPYWQAKEKNLIMFATVAYRDNAYIYRIAYLKDFGKKSEKIVKATESTCTQTSP